MKSFDIIYIRYLANNKKEVTKGGVQTYITDLCDVIVKIGGKVRVVQFSDENFQYNITDKINVVGFNIKSRSDSKRVQKLYDAAVRTRKEKNVITIFASDIMIPSKVYGTCIAIQHGVSWDAPKDTNHSLVRQVAAKAFSAYKMVKKFRNVSLLVCVDYNFLNWYRTQVKKVLGNVLVIPNYSRVAPIYEKPCNGVNVIFARRLFDYRGTRVFTTAVKRLLDERDNVTVTIAGSGPDENWMKEQLKSYSNVSFIRYESSESLEIHKDKHIAVVPTVGSEGTSLSLLEAMSAQCAVICSNVGGLTNIVINGYNGLMVNSGDTDELYEALKKLVDDREFRETIAKNGYETVKCSFSYERWAEEWKKILLGLKNG